MSLRRIAGVAVAAAVVSGAGLLLSSPTGAVTPPTPITLNLTGMASTSCPLPLNGSMAVTPDTAVQFKQGNLGLATGERLTISPAPNSTDPATSTPWIAVPAAGATPITFTRSATYHLTWQSTTVNLLGQVAVVTQQTGKLIIASSVQNCAVAVQVPVPSVSASAVPSPITSAINGGLGGVASTANSLLNPINGALPTLPPVPTGLPTLPPVPGAPVPGANPPGGDPGGNVPGTSYKPSGPTVADRTVPDGYGSGSGQGGVYVPVTGSSTGGANGQAQGQQAAGNAAPTGASSSAPGVKSGGSPRTVELASNRPRSALGALPTLAVILAILALSGATAYYARTFLLQPAAAPVKAPRTR